MNRKFLGLIALMLLFATASFAQHTVQLNTSAGAISTLLGSVSGGQYLLPNGGGTVLTQLFGSPTVSNAWLHGGNNNGAPPIAGYGTIGTLDNVDMTFVTNGIGNTRMTLTAAGALNIAVPTTINTTGNAGVPAVYALGQYSTARVSAVFTDNVNSSVMIGHPVGLTGAIGVINGQDISIGGFANPPTTFTAIMNFQTATSNSFLNNAVGNSTIGRNGNTTNLLSTTIGIPNVPVTATITNVVTRNGGGNLEVSSLSVVSGTGTVNTIAKWTPSTTTLGNSALTDNGVALTYGGTNINLNTATTSATGYKISGATILHNTGTTNTFLGVSSGTAIGAGAANTGLGANALSANTTGPSNTGVGTNALLSNTGGANNTAIGVDALRNNVGGNSNIAIGGAALLNSNTNNNVGVGFFALSNSTGGDNTAVGNGAGGVNTTGTSNTYLGSGANTSNNNLTNATALGAGATVGSSNSIQLGNASVNLISLSGSAGTTIQQLQQGVAGTLTLATAANPNGTSGAMLLRTGNVGGGAGNGPSGDVTLLTGDNGTNAAPGTVNLFGGNSIGFGTTNHGGNIVGIGGSSNNGNGGNISLTSGNGAIGGAGGSLTLTAGTGPGGNGGITLATTNTNIAINPGAGNTVTTNGKLSTAGTATIGSLPASASTTVVTAGAGGLLESRSIASIAATGTGTQNFITKWNNAGGTTLGNSLLTDDGSNLIYNSNFNVSSAGAVTGVTTLSTSADASIHGLPLGTGGAFQGTIFGLNVTASSNTTAIGFFANNQPAGSSDNTAIGTNALRSTGGGVATFSTAIGEAAGQLAAINQDHNTFVGFNANATGAVSNSTMIGNGASVTTSNTIQLGNAAVSLVNSSGGYNAGNTSSFRQLNPAADDTYDLGTNALRWRSIKISASLSNNSENPIAGDNQGLGGNGLNWQINGGGFVATFINQSAVANADGVQIAVASNTGNGRALVVTTGTNFNPTGGGGIRNEVFRVMNNGATTINNGLSVTGNTSTGTLTVGAGSPITKVLIVEGGPSPFAYTAPAGGKVTVTFGPVGGLDKRDQIVATWDDAAFISGGCIWSSMWDGTNLVTNIYNPTGAAVTIPIGANHRWTITRFN